jgi:hypothetical protein
MVLFSTASLTFALANSCWEIQPCFLLADGLISGIFHKNTQPLGTLAHWQKSVLFGHFSMASKSLK